MANQINVAGVSTIKVDVTGSLETLGIAYDKVTIREQPFYHNVHSDEHGGPQGPEIDKQWLGEKVFIRCEMSKYDPDVANKLRAFLQDNAAALKGTVQAADIGALMIQGDKFIRVLIDNDNDPRNYPICVIHEPIEDDPGTKYTTLILEFEAHRNQSSGVVWNTVAS